MYYSLQESFECLAVSTFVCAAIALQFFVKDFTRRETVKSLIEIADAQGYAAAKIFNLHTLSHNSEFYGAGRLIRETDGKLEKFLGVPEVVQEMRRENERVILVIVPLEYASQLAENASVTARKLGDNGDVALFAVFDKEK